MRSDLPSLTDQSGYPSLRDEDIRILRFLDGFLYSITSSVARQLDFSGLEFDSRIS